jgi:hypothetical protein
MEDYISKAAQEIGKIIGQPIDPNLPVPAVLNEIFDYETAEPGEEVKRYEYEDTNAGDTITAVSTDGHIVNYKIDPQTPAVIPFSSVQSELQRLHVDAILNSPDQAVIARRKAAITRGLDKKITKEALDLIIAANGGSQEVVQATGMDLYDLIIAMKHKIEDYGDNYILLVGTKVSEAIDVYDKVNATNFNYRIGLVETLKEKGIKVVKVYATAVFNFIDTTASGDPETSNIKVLDTDKMILVARDSTIQKGKPGIYVRRKIAPAIAQMMGSDVDATFRATTVMPLPVNVGGTNTLAFGIHAFEQRVCALLNYRGTAWATLA